MRGLVCEELMKEAQNRLIEEGISVNNLLCVLVFVNEYFGKKAEVCHFLKDTILSIIVDSFDAEALFSLFITIIYLQHNELLGIYDIDRIFAPET